MFLSNRRTTEAFHPCGCTNKRVKRAAARHHGRRYNTLARAHNMRRAATISFSTWASCPLNSLSAHVQHMGILPAELRSAHWHPAH